MKSLWKARQPDHVIFQELSEHENSSDHENPSAHENPSDHENPSK